VKNNVNQVVPFLAVSNMERSLRYYLDGLGFVIQYKWEPDGRIRWCWMKLGGAAIMMQEYLREGHHAFKPQGKLGEGVSLMFICEDAVAIYREVTARGIEASEPQVGNAMWVTELIDPDGYRIAFESPTDVAEETKLSEL